MYFSMANEKCPGPHVIKRWPSAPSLTCDSAVREDHAEYASDNDFEIGQLFVRTLLQYDAYLYANLLFCE